MNILTLFTSFDGRISRAQWWMGFILLFLCSMALLIFVQATLNAALGRELTDRNVFTSMVALLLVWPEAALTTKRFNDRGHAPWVAEVFVLVSISSVLVNHFELFSDSETMNAGGVAIWAALTAFSLWVLVDNGFTRGTQGPNAYGADPLTE